MASRMQAIRAMRIFVFAQVMGVVSILGIALLVNQAGINGEPDILSWFGLGMAVLMVAGQFVIPNFSASAALRQISGEQIRNADDDQKFELISPAYRTRLIVACAMMEGAAILNLVAYITGEYLGNLIAAVVLAAMIAEKFPTQSKVEFWVQNRAREIEMR